MRVEVVASLDQLEALRPRWQKVLGDTPEATVFAGPAWVVGGFRHLRAAGTPYVVVVRDGDEVEGVAPFTRTCLGAGRAGFQLLVSAGTDHGYYGEPLLGAAPERAAGVLAAHLAGLVSKGTAAVNLRRLRGSSPLLTALEERSDVACRPSGPAVDSAVVRFDRMECVEDYFHKVGREHGIPRRVRRMNEVFDKVDYRAADHDVDAALDALQALQERHWGPGFARTFAGARRSAFYRAAVHELVNEGNVSLSTLRLDDRIVGVSVVSRVGDLAVPDDCAYDHDRELARFGIGQYERFQMLRYAWDTGVTTVDTGPFDEGSNKLKWTNGTVASRSYTLTASGWRGRMALKGRRVAMSYRARRLARSERSSR